MPRDLTRAGRPIDMDHDQLLTGAACPHALIDQLVRHGVLRATDTDQRLPVHLPRLPEHMVCGSLGSRCNLSSSSQPEQRLERGAMRARVDIGHERLARRLELREARISRAEVVIGRDQIGLRDPHGRLAAALRLGVRGTHVAIVSP